MNEFEVKKLKLSDEFYIGAGGIDNSHPESTSWKLDWKEMLFAFNKIAETGCDLDIRLVHMARSRLDYLQRQSAGANPLSPNFSSDIFRYKGSVAKALNSMMKTVHFNHAFLNSPGSVFCRAMIFIINTR